MSKRQREKDWDGTLIFPAGRSFTVSQEQDGSVCLHSLSTWRYPLEEAAAPVLGDTGPAEDGTSLGSSGQGTSPPSLSAQGGKCRLSCFWKGHAVSAHSQCRRCFAVSMEWEDTQHGRHLPTIVPKPTRHQATHQGNYPPPKSLFKKH